MTASAIAESRNYDGTRFTTAEIKSRIEAMFDARAHRTPTDRFGSSEHDEHEP